ncbi:nanos homolog 2 [Ornithorhynchus anatinus]|uniref:nanos homolog 2 n=1 Tax=Ornithorhynchus anatinus TaxID=9258 RepID=UPI0010A7ACAF|nr:nanos homolog 2 [Ornithorhynchus anatinus]
MQTPAHFHMWRDYLGLSQVVLALAEARRAGAGRDPGREEAEGGREEAAGPLRPPAPRPFCNFCKHNGESRAVYRSHGLKAPDGRVLCPILRDYLCPLCGASGDGAHTLRYCPLNPGARSLFGRRGLDAAGPGVRP